MGGSQVFLEEGETQDAETMIKCIVIASGNDASVAMAEHLAGSEQEFVRRMNERAQGLGMKNTNFEDCCGLTESEDHYTTARDIALMSRELITKYPQVLAYSSIWMENITHQTRKGTTEFGLTNTNKLLRSYEGCVGLKTGSTSAAKYCLSAVAERNNISLISVVMAAPNYKIRFKDAASMLNYGFARCSLYRMKARCRCRSLRSDGAERIRFLWVRGNLSVSGYRGNPVKEVARELKLPKEVKAPVKKGAQAGEVVYSMGDKILGNMPVCYAADVPAATYPDSIGETFRKIFSLSG